MTILAFDCAGAGCSAVLWRDGAALARRSLPSKHGQAETLLPMIQAVLADAKLGYGDLAALATTVGPGSFTGLRAGLAAARGIALATGLPAVGVSTLDAAAHATSADERRGRTVIAAIDSRRDDLYVQIFDERLAAAAAPAVRNVAAAAREAPAGKLLLTGDAIDGLAQELKRAGRDVAVSRAAGNIDAAVVAAIAAERLKHGGEGAPLRPLYLRPPDVTAPPIRRPNPAA